MLYPKHDERFENLFSDQRVFVGSAAGSTAVVVATPTCLTLADLVARFPAPTEAIGDVSTRS